MLSQRTANLVFVAVVLAACGYFARVAEGFVTSGLLASSGLPSKFFPQVTLGLTAVCAVVVGLAYALRGGAGGDEGETVFESALEARQGLSVLLVAVLCVVVWQSVGFLPMALLLGPLSLVAMGVRRPLVYLTVLIITATVSVVFTYGLGVQLR